MKRKILICPKCSSFNVHALVFGTKIELECQNYFPSWHPKAKTVCDWSDTIKYQVGNFKDKKEALYLLAPTIELKKPVSCQLTWVGIRADATKGQRYWGKKNDNEYYMIRTYCYNGNIMCLFTGKSAMNVMYNQIRNKPFDAKISVRRFSKDKSVCNPQNHWHNEVALSVHQTPQLIS